MAGGRDIIVNRGMIPPSWFLRPGNSALGGLQLVDLFFLPPLGLRLEEEDLVYP
jgi:hypothetical protein